MVHILFLKAGLVPKFLFFFMAINIIIENQVATLRTFSLMCKPFFHIKDSRALSHRLPVGDHL